MPRTLGQWVGVVVTTIVVMGARNDLALAAPLGVFAGALATFFVSLDAQRRLVRRTLVDISKRP